MIKSRCSIPKSRSSLPCFLAILILTLIVYVPSVGSASGNMIPVPPINHVYIRSNGAIEPSTPLITVHDNVYTLTGDLTNTTVEIERDGVTFDGAGHSITGHSTSYQNAINISNRTNITIKNLTVNQFGSGILMDHASNCTLTGNIMTTFAAFNFLNSDDNSIVDNVATQGYGIYGSGSNNLIMHNNFTSGLSGGGNGMGVLLGGNNNTITRNTIIHEVSINLGNSQHNMISYNTILNGSSGILLAKSSNNLVFGNIVKGKSSNDSGALYISYDSSGNVVFNNTFENNALGVSLGAQVADFVWNNVYNNTFYWNNFINNAQSVWIAPGAPVNHWDNGEQGNYWSDFHGVDSNADKISESPYVINSNNTDYHPLMAPTDFSNQEPSSSPAPSPSPPTPTPTAASPTATPTILPTPSPTASILASNSPAPLQSMIPSLTPTATVPEFPAWIITLGAAVIAATLVVALILRYHKGRS